VQASLPQLHSYGVVHGDLNKFNIIITADGPRFFDLEKSILDTNEEISKDEFSRLQQEELDGLEKALHDEKGRP
jgi:RIO-like serine/threonine protein kinase